MWRTDIIRNDFNRQYKDNDALYKSLVKEDYWYTQS